MGGVIQLIRLLSLIGPEVPAIIQAIETLVLEIEKAVTAGAGGQAFAELKAALVEAKQRLAP